MKNVFKKETPNYSSERAETPYQRAKKEWDDRLGGVNAQSANWRFVAVLSLLVSFVLLILLIISLSMGKDRVFVAQVAKTGRVVNVASLQTQYRPTVAQEEYFIAHFIKLIRELPLDPVVAKRNWLNAYSFLTQSSSEKLNQYLRKDNPLKYLGKKTVTVQIDSINPISDKSFQVEWTEVSIGSDGQAEGKQTISGVFTIVVHQPTSQQAILKNPLGIYIVDFNFSSRENK
jgi:type IV secretion system protein TrbF